MRAPLLLAGLFSLCRGAAVASDAALQQADAPPAPDDKSPPAKPAKGADEEARRKADAAAKVDTKKAEEWARPDWPAISFSEVSAAAGIECMNLSGAPDKPRLVDTLGSGMCWFDYDGDGWLDLFIPNGSTLEAVLGEKKNDVSDKLFRNQGDGTTRESRCACPARSSCCADSPNTVGYRVAPPRRRPESSTPRWTPSLPW